MKKISGTGVALITPFKNDKSVDFNALKTLINNVIDGGIDFLVVLGTTGETTSLNKSEKQKVIEFVIKTNNARLPMVLGLGGNNTANLINEINSHDLTPFSAILSVTTQL